MTMMTFLGDAAGATAEENALHLQLDRFHRQRTIAEFEKQSGIKVTTMSTTRRKHDARLLAGSSGYDVIASTNILAVKSRQGLRSADRQVDQLEKLDPRILAIQTFTTRVMLTRCLHARINGLPTMSP